MILKDILINTSVPSDLVGPSDLPPLDSSQAILAHPCKASYLMDILAVDIVASRLYCCGPSGRKALFRSKVESAVGPYLVLLQYLPPPPIRFQHLSPHASRGHRDLRDSMPTDVPNMGREGEDKRLSGRSKLCSDEFITLNDNADSKGTPQLEQVIFSFNWSR